MSNPSRQKGTAYEVRVRDYLNDSGVFSSKVQRAPLWGSADQGDLLNTGSFTFELKAVKQIDLAKFVNEAQAESAAAGTRWGVAVVKRRNHTIEKSYVVMTLEDFVDLIGALPSELR